MKYNGFEIKKIAVGVYKIYDVFGVDVTNHEYKTSVIAKGVVDNVLTKAHKSNRYMPTHYRQYWWGVMDKVTALYVTKEDKTKLLFKNREDCFAWCEEHNSDNSISN